MSEDILQKLTSSFDLTDFMNWEYHIVAKFFRALGDDFTQASKAIKVEELTFQDITKLPKTKLSTIFEIKGKQLDLVVSVIDRLKKGGLNLLSAVKPSASPAVAPPARRSLFYSAQPPLVPSQSVENANKRKLIRPVDSDDEEGFFTVPQPQSTIELPSINNLIKSESSNSRQRMVTNPSVSEDPKSSVNASPLFRSQDDVPMSSTVMVVEETGASTSYHHHASPISNELFTPDPIPVQPKAKAKRVSLKKHLAPVADDEPFHNEAATEETNASSENTSEGNKGAKRQKLVSTTAKTTEVLPEEGHNVGLSAEPKKSKAKKKEQQQQKEAQEAAPVETEKQNKKSTKSAKNKADSIEEAHTNQTETTSKRDEKNKKANDSGATQNTGATQKNKKDLNDEPTKKAKKTQQTLSKSKKKNTKKSSNYASDSEDEIPPHSSSYSEDKEQHSSAEEDIYKNDFKRKTVRRSNNQAEYPSPTAPVSNNIIINNNNNNRKKSADADSSSDSAPSGMVKLETGALPPSLPSLQEVFSITYTGASSDWLYDAIEAQFIALSKQEAFKDVNDESGSSKQKLSVYTKRALEASRDFSFVPLNVIIDGDATRPTLKVLRALCKGGWILHPSVITDAQWSFSGVKDKEKFQHPNFVRREHRLEKPIHGVMYLGAEKILDGWSVYITKSTGIKGEQTINPLINRNCVREMVNNIGAEVVEDIGQLIKLQQQRKKNKKGNCICLVQSNEGAKQVNKLLNTFDKSDSQIKVIGVRWLIESVLSWKVCDLAEYEWEFGQLGTEASQTW